MSLFCVCVIRSQLVTILNLLCRKDVILRLAMNEMEDFQRHRRTLDMLVKYSNVMILQCLTQQAVNRLPVFNLTFSSGKSPNAKLSELMSEGIKSERIGLR